MIPKPDEYGAKLQQIKNKHGNKAYWTEIKRLLKEDFLYLCYALGFPDVGTPFHVGLMNWIISFESGQHTRGLGLFPRGHLKTTLLTTAWPIRLILRKEGNIRIGLFSHDEESAHTFAGAVKDICEENVILKQAFPHIFWEFIGPAASPWRNDAFRLKGLPPYVKEATMEAWDINAVPTGRHYDVIICDDIVDKKSTKTPERRAELIENYRLLRPLLEPGGARVNIGTNYHYYDLYEDIKNGRMGTGWRIAVKPAISEDGKILFPERFVKTKAERFARIQPYLDRGEAPPKTESLEEIEEELGTVIYNAQYLLKVMPPGDVIFKAEDIIMQDPPEGKQPEYVIGIDPAKTTKSYSAYTALSVISVFPGKKIFGEEFINAKIETGEIIDMIFRLVQRYTGSKVALETTGWNDLLRLVREEQDIREIWFDIIEKKPKDSKEDRTKNVLEFPMKRGQIRFRRDLMHNKAFQTLRQNLLDFPQLKWWDLMDSFVNAVSEADHPGFDKVVVKEPEGRTLNSRLKSMNRRGAKKTVWR